MNYKIEKNEQYALISLDESTFGENIAAAYEKVIVVLYREGLTNIIADFSKVTEIDSAGLALIRKATRVCRNEGGLFIIACKDDDLLDIIDVEKIPDLILLPTTDEAIDAVFMNELENEFADEEDEDFDMEDGFGIEGENRS